MEWHGQRITQVLISESKNSSGNTITETSKIYLHQCISSSTCLPLDKTAVNSSCQTHGFVLSFFLILDVKIDSEKLSFENRRMSYNAFCADVFYSLQKKKDGVNIGKKIPWPLLSLSSLLSLFLL